MWILLFFFSGHALVVLGVFVIVAAIIIAFTSSAKNSAMHGEGVIMIGPIPIIFGKDKKSTKAIFLALALTLTIIVLIIGFLR